MRAISQSEAVSSISALLDELDKEPVVIRKDGRDIAYLISPDEFETTREARTRRLLDISDIASAEIEENVRLKGLDRFELMKSLERKAS